MRKRLMVSGAAAGAIVGAGLAFAAPTARTVPFGASGDAVDGTSGQPLALTSSSVLVHAEGPDGTAGTQDDVTLLVQGLGTGTPTTTALATPESATAASRIERLCATRAAMVAAGADGSFGTVDDEILVLDRLGSANTVTAVVVGGLGDNQQFTPERLTSSSFVVPSFGADLLADTADDEVLLVTLGGATPVVTRLAAPFQRSGGRTRIAAISPGAFVLASDGPDRKVTTADDIIQLFRGSGTTWTRTDLAAPGLNRRSAGRSVRLDRTHSLAVSAGTDLADSTADDLLFVVDAAAGTIASIPVPFAKNGSAAQATPLDATTVALATMGADGLDGTADDSVAVVSGIGGTPSVTFVVVGVTGDNNECRPVRLADDTFALATFGADRIVGTSDDAVTIVHGVPDAPVVQTVVVGAIAGGTTSALVPISGGSVMLAGGGADNVMGTGDDAVVVLGGIKTGLTISKVPVGGAFDSLDAFRFVPEVLGAGRAALLTSGADLDLGAGGDDGVCVIDGLTLGNALAIARLSVDLARLRPVRESRVSVRATLRLEDPLSLLAEDITVSVGNASQTISAGDVVATNSGRILRYVDKSASPGFVRSFAYDLRTSVLRIEARGADADLASTSRAYVPVGIEIGTTIIPQAVAAKPRRNGFVYNR